MKELLIIGGDGTLGRVIKAHCVSNKIKVSVTSRRPNAIHHLNLDQAPLNWVAPGKPNAAILCIGPKNIRDCEINQKSTQLVNVTRVIQILAQLQNQGIPCIVLSTSQVFGANPKTAPTENQTQEPTCEYARQKVEVENWITSNRFHTVVRLSKVVHSNLEIIQKWNQERDITAFSNLYLSPIGLAYTAEGLIHIAKNIQPGVAHLSAKISISYFEMAQTIGYKPRSKLYSLGNTREGARLCMTHTHTVYGINPAKAASQLDFSIS